MTVNPAVDSFVLSFPDGWFEISLDSSDVAEQVRVRLAETHLGPLSIDVRRQALLVARMARHVRESGVVLASALVEPLTADDGEAELVLAVVGFLATRHASELGVASISFEQMQAVVEPESAAPVERLEGSRVIDLPSGPAVRDRTMRTGEIEGLDEPVKILEVRYHLLVGPSEGIAVLGFLTPNIELADEMLELFEAIASTLEFVAA